MSRYWILEAVAYMDNGEPLYYRTIPKEPVEIADDVAETLGDKVRRVDSVQESAEETPQDRPEGIEGKTGDPLDGVDVPEEDSPEPPKPKRRRKAEEEEPDGDKEL